MSYSSPRNSSKKKDTINFGRNIGKTQEDILESMKEKFKNTISTTTSYKNASIIRIENSTWIFKYKEKTGDHFLFGFVDMNWIVLEDNILSLKKSSEGFFAFSRESKNSFNKENWYIDENWKILILSKEIKDLRDFKEWIGIFKSWNKYWAINKEWKIFIDNCSKLWKPSEGFLSFNWESNWFANTWWINSDWVILAEWFWICWEFKDWEAYFTKYFKKAVIHWILSFKFNDGFSVFTNKKTKLQWYISTKSEILLQDCDSCEPFNDWYAKIIKEWKQFIINTKGQKIHFLSPIHILEKKYINEKIYLNINWKLFLENKLFPN